MQPGLQRGARAARHRACQVNPGSAIVPVARPQTPAAHGGQRVSVHSAPGVSAHGEHTSSAVLEPTSALLTAPPGPSNNVLPATLPHVAPHGEAGFNTYKLHEAYKVDKAPIGQGVYGVVYRAQHRASGREVAIKVVQKDQEHRTREDVIASIKQEVALWRACQPCPYVVRLEGVHEDHQFVYMVQQLCRGGDLRSVLQGGPLSERDTAQVMRAVLSTVLHCHNNDHTYGDVKPANFLLLHPHSSAGCQQFPLSITNDTTGPTASINDSGELVVMPPAHRLNMSTSIHEHMLALLELPEPLSPSRSASDTASDSDVSAATSSCESTLPLPAKLLSVGDAPAVLPQWMTVLAASQPLPHTSVSVEDSAGQLEVQARQACGTSCAGELVVLATDFGCSQPLKRGRRRATAQRIGSPVYMSPEMWQSGGQVGPAVDVWSAGVMMYQLLTGRYPFWTASPEVVDSMQMWEVVCGVQSNPVVLSGEPWDRMSRSCCQLLAAMLERDPGQRITAAAALQHPWMLQQLGQPPLQPLTEDEECDQPLPGADAVHGTHHAAGVWPYAA